MVEKTLYANQIARKFSSNLKCGKYKQYSTFLRIPPMNMYMQNGMNLQNLLSFHRTKLQKHDIQLELIYYLLARFGSIRASSASLAADMAFLASAEDGSSEPDMSISGLMVVDPSIDWLC